uniref:Uncharacterized protein n=1 Tax=Cacopsylla melanoneura TaxID=428564 RepID=A0A8D9ERN9_9HEMI
MKISLQLLYVHILYVPTTPLLYIIYCSTTIKVNDKNVNIDPVTIFQRLCCVTKPSENNLHEHFKFELAPYPSGEWSLFTEEGMRKGTTSTFYYAFKKCRY